MRRERLSFRALRDVSSCEIDAKSALGRVSALRGVLRRERLVCGVSASYAVRVPLMRRKRLSFGALRDVWSCEIGAKSALGRVSILAGLSAA